MPTTPGPDAGRVPAAVRRAVLPWYRKTPASRRFLYVPWWSKRVLHIPVLNLLFLLVTFPVVDLAGDPAADRVTPRSSRASSRSCSARSRWPFAGSGTRGRSR